MPTLEDFARQLASFKSVWNTGNDQQKNDSAAQGQQLRSQAAAAGIDLGKLENSAMQMANGRTMNNVEQSYANDYISKVKPAAGNLPAQVGGSAPNNVNPGNPQQYQTGAAQTQGKTSQGVTTQGATTTGVTSGGGTVSDLAKTLSSYDSLNSTFANPGLGNNGQGTATGIGAFSKDPALWQQEYDRTNAVMQNRQQQGLGLEQQQGWLQQLIANKPVAPVKPEAAPPPTFSSGGLSDHMNNQETAGGGATPIDPSRFNNPDQLKSYIEMLNNVLAPVGEQQKSGILSSYNKALGGLRDQWASRGLLASGEAAAQERQGMEGLVSQLNGVDVTRLQQALTMAPEWAKIGLSESGQRFDQNQTNREFDQTRANQAVQNYLNALKNQQDESHWNADFGMKQNQQQFDQGMAQQDFGLKEGSLTGRYLPYEARGLLSTIMNNKGAWGKATTDAERQQLSNANQDLYRQLDLMGVDSRLVNGDVSLSDALKNVGGLYKNTLGQNQFEFDKTKFNDQLAWDKQKTGDQLAFDKSQWGDKYNLDLQNSALDKWYKETSAAINWDQNKLARDKYNTEKEVADATKRSSQATQRALGDIMAGASSRSQAMQKLKDQQEAYDAAGVDVGLIIKNIDSFFNQPKDTAASGGAGGILGPK